jgi:hypothetical protein
MTADNSQHRDVFLDSRYNRRYMSVGTDNSQRSNMFVNSRHNYRNMNMSTDNSQHPDTAIISYKTSYALLVTTHATLLSLKATSSPLQLPRSAVASDIWHRKSSQRQFDVESSE